MASYIFCSSFSTGISCPIFRSDYPDRSASLIFGPFSGSFFHVLSQFLCEAIKGLDTTQLENENQLNDFDLGLGSRMILLQSSSAIQYEA